ncbi:hypothetical protein DFJ58DRAFT_734942 [Suillus subalutaceus]|uniref:uncharacterized protein n=1 Tax=Suillus subalutaceus TaxID=48586 RepID=UPI001B866DF9|nr:uncharacterized protein DFJ58DRAFT_734942 [Suillus subalutaceus]KAG1836519.1 hypothetical protein DFJ58DRAFT_734942 [Suillus subalutaceus]
MPEWESQSKDNTIKLWAFESHQSLASFRVQEPHSVILSLKYYICDTSPDILASIWHATHEAQPNINTPRNPRCTVRRNPIRSPIRIPPKPLPTIDPQQPIFLHYLRKLLSSSFRMDAIPPIRNDEPRSPLHSPATSPLPPNCFPSVQATTQPASQSPTAIPTTFKSHIRHLSGQSMFLSRRCNAAADAPAKDDDDDLICDEDYLPPPPPTHGSQPQSAARSINFPGHSLDISVLPDVARRMRSPINA